MAIVFMSVIENKKKSHYRQARKYNYTRSYAKMEKISNKRSL